MLPEQQQRIMGYFIEEAKDHLNTIEQGLLSLQSTIEDADKANEIFRAAHSVKGGAAMLGLESIQKTAHRMEDYFKILKESPVRVDRTLETMFLRISDGLKDLLEQLEGPFGLTPDKAQAIMASVDPVFGQLEEHLNRLVKQAEGQLSADTAPYSREAPNSLQASDRTSTALKVSDGSSAEALQARFERDVASLLRQMLTAFKQTDTAERRKNIQDICAQLTAIGEPFELSAWCDLIETARLAAASLDNDYRTLAPILIKEIKKAQDLVLSGRASEIAVSESMQSLLPEDILAIELSGSEDDELKALADDLALEAGLFSSAFDSSDDSFDKLFTDDVASEGEGELLFNKGEAIAAKSVATARLENSAELPSAEDAEDFDLGDFDSEADPVSRLSLDLEFDEIPLELSTLNRHVGSEEKADESLDALLATVNVTGPDVGTEELNSLADLFDGDLEELDNTLGGHAFISEEMQLNPEKIDLAAADDLTDLLTKETDEDPSPAVTADDGIEDDLFGGTLTSGGFASNIASLDEGDTEIDYLSLELDDLSSAEPVENSEIIEEDETRFGDRLADTTSFDQNFAALESDLSSDIAALSEDPWAEAEMSQQDDEDLFGISDLLAVPGATNDSLQSELDQVDSDIDLLSLEQPDDLVNLTLNESAIADFDVSMELESVSSADLLADTSANKPAKPTSRSSSSTQTARISPKKPVVTRELEIEFPTLTGAKLQEAEKDIDSFFLDERIDEKQQEAESSLLIDELIASPDNSPEQLSDDPWGELAVETTLLDADFLNAETSPSFEVALEVEQAGSELDELLEDSSDQHRLDTSASVDSEVDSLWDSLAASPHAESDNLTADSPIENDLVEDEPAVEDDDLDLEFLSTDDPGLDNEFDFTSEQLDSDPSDQVEENQSLYQTNEAEEIALTSDELSFDDDGFVNALLTEDLSELGEDDADEDHLDILSNTASVSESDRSLASSDDLLNEIEDELTFDELDFELDENTTDSSTVAPNSEVKDLSDFDFLAADFRDDSDSNLESDLENNFESDLASDSEANSANDLDNFEDLESLLSDEGVQKDAIGNSAVFSETDFSKTEETLLGSNLDDREDFGDLERLLEEGEPESPTMIAPQRRSPQVRRSSGAREQNMRVSIGHLDNLSNLVGELVVSRNTLERDQERLRQFLDNLLFQVQQLNDVGQRMRDLYERSLLESSLMSNRRAHSATHNRVDPSELGHATGEIFDALEMDRFTGFHSLSQEMIELIVRVRESSSDIGYTVESSDQVTRQFRQITTQLQEGLNTARMIAFSQAADRLPRAVRDISLKCGKEARLIVEGQDTLIDKMIVEHLYDPLTHLVNNAITHGIETPAERTAAGKSAEGSITVRAFYQGNQTVIYVADDGGGINTEFVKQKAIEKGLITQADAATLSDIETYDLLFHAGFSTRDQADDFAGRGVGMDVVRTSLAEIRGSVTVDSELGKGTSFTIRLPLTLSISKALSCVSNQARIAFPMDGVEDMLDVSRDRIVKDKQNQDCVRWRDTLLPFQPVTELLKFNRTLGRSRVYGGSQDDDVLSIIVLRSANTFVAVQVDQVIGEQEIVIKQLEGPVPKPLGIAGATVLGDGRVMPIADVLELIDIAMGRVRREPASMLWADNAVTAEEAPAKNDPTVLIVDDSITVRELLSMSFNKIGYRVEQARDGQEAWDKLRSGLPCDLVFCDIEMPRMDGLELLSRMQKDSHLKRIPIAMLTSRGADRHRQMAVDLGASGYFTKPYLEEALLDAAQRMLNGETLAKGRGG
jgi:chemotaxis protein histidine kinase CheA/CheY-like chemotaxis protein